MLLYKPVAEVEMCVIPVRMHQFVHFRVQNLYQRPHVRKVAVHRIAVRKVLHHTFHQVAEAGISQALVIENYQKWCHQVAHALHVSYVEVFPYVAISLKKGLVFGQSNLKNIACNWLKYVWYKNKILHSNLNENKETDTQK